MNQKERTSKEEGMKYQDERIRQALDRVKHKIVVLSGKGGVGKSTIAVNLAVSLSEAGYKTGLMDVDLHGPSVPRLLGLSNSRPSTSENHINPISYNENLKVVSIESFLEKLDQAIIWRGPMKSGAIRQFLSDVAWGELDYLILDSPPGTGDEPMTVAQSIPQAKAVIVTTPQEISLADVRKSINFCSEINLPILGLIENMSGYVCSQCGHQQNIFGTGGGERTAKEMGLHFLGKIPIDPETVLAGDCGRPNLSVTHGDTSAKAFHDVFAAFIEAVDKQTEETITRQEHKKKIAQEGITKIAIPVSNGALSNHFGHCEHFEVFGVKDSRVIANQTLSAPPHEPGAIPRWLNSEDVNVIIAGGMGTRAQGFFNEYGIKVIIGAPAFKPEKLVDMYLSGDLKTGENICDH